MKIRKQDVKIILKDFVFPISEQILQVIEIPNLSFYVSIHKKNGFAPGGFTIPKDILYLPQDLIVNNVYKKFEGYIETVSYIECEFYTMNVSNYHKSFKIYFEELFYRIEMLNKSFSYGNLPNSEDKKNLIIFFKNEWNNIRHNIEYQV